jgi:hypothetical protein
MKEFIRWLHSKFDNIGSLIGYGKESLVFEYGDKVIKFTHSNIDDIKKYVNKDIDGLVKIFEVGTIDIPNDIKKLDVFKTKNRKIQSYKDFISSTIDIMDKDSLGYVVMEKLDTKVQDQLFYVAEQIYNVLLSDPNELPEDFKMIYDRVLKQKKQAHTFALLYLFVKKNYLKVADILKKRGYYNDLVAEIIETFRKVQNHFPNWDDVYEAQFGRNSKGELVAFDVF